MFIAPQFLNRRIETVAGHMIGRNQKFPFSFASAYAIVSAEGQVGAMVEDVLMLNGLSVELLTQLSYRSRLGLSLIRTLRHFEREALIAELVSMTEWLDEQTVLSEIALDYRIKSYASIVGKYERYLNSSRHVGQVFNDILGFRAFCDSYDSVLALTFPSFSVADLSKVSDGELGETQTAK